MTYEMFIRSEMVRFAVEEAQQYGGTNNMLAVLHVLRNRVMAGWGDWLEVVERARYQRSTNYPLKQGNFRSNDVRVLFSRIDDIYTRVDLSDLTSGALWYWDQNTPMNDWFKNDIIGHPEEHKRVAHVGPVWFFN